mmetsp:Transcript_25798/g.31623  ORF Transcript_25798/g.31623 Transcript_25798/m.31623 type:complete len:295 (+) Transcript_25798:117-1001(+)
MRAIINNQEQDTKTTIKGDVNIEEGLSGDNCSVIGNKSTETMSTIRSGSGVGDTDYKNAHIGRSREYWRDMILGVNDGLVSTFLLVAGVYGSGLDSRSILLTAISGMIAGAISMAGGEYVATKTQEEVMKAECDLEQKDIKEHKSDELRYLSELLETIGIPETESIDDSTFAVRRAILEYYKNNDDAHLRVNVALAFGSVEASERSPLIASVVAFCLFSAGALTSVIPFVVIHDRYDAMVASFICTILAIWLVGAVKTWATKGSWLISAFENFIITSGGGAVAYGIGLLFGGTF